MSKIIETNISLSDFQSRVIEEDWDIYVKYFTNSTEIKSKIYIDILGMQVGKSIPEDCVISELKYDDFHLSCYIEHAEWKGIKFAYRTN